MFWTHDPVAPWQNDAWLAQMRRTLRPNQYLRMIENRFVSTESPFIEMALFDACVDPNARALVSEPSLPIFVAIDASTKHNSTAVVACAWDRKASKARLIWHRIFQPSPDEPLNFEATIERTLLDLRHRFTIRKAIFDPWQMQATAQRLRAHNIHVEEFPQSSGRLTESSQNLFELIKSGNIVFGKDKQTHKIDVVVALGMAALIAAQDGPRNPYAQFGFWGDWEIRWTTGQQKGHRWDGELPGGGSELKELERAIEAAGSAVEAGRDEIRLEAGVFDPHKFDQLAAPVEQKVNAPWLRKRNDKINVVDLERREERPATPAEIETGVYADDFDAYQKLTGRRAA